MLPSRPDVELLIGPCVVGEMAEGMVVLSSHEPFRLNALQVHIRGREFAAKAVANGFYARTVELTGARTFDAGRHRLPFSFSLSRDCPPSQLGIRCGISYEVEVHADVPWSHDRHASFGLQVVPNPTERREPIPPRVYRSPRPDASSSRPQLELSLGSGSVAVGDELHGAVAASGYRGRAAFRITLESVVNWNGAIVQRGPKLLAALETRPEEGMAPFRLKVPADTPVTLTTRRPDQTKGAMTRTWRLKVSAGIGDNEAKLSVPIELHGGPRTEAARVRVVGEPRITSVWSGAAEAAGFIFESDALHRQDGDVVCRVQREYVEDEGILVTVSIRYPRLGLDVRVEPLKHLQRLDRILSRRLTKSCALKTRDLAQTKQALGSLILLFGDFLISFDDELCHLRFPDDGTDAIKLHSILAHARRITDRLRELSLNVPPPTGMEDAVPAWNALAAALQSPLSVGDLHISHRRRSVDVSVRASFDSQGIVEGLLLHGSPADGEPLSRIENIEEGSNVQEILSAHLEGEVLERGVRAAEGGSVRLGPGGLSIAFDWRWGEAGADGSETMLRRVADLHRVVAALSTDRHGPYR